jgi:hypothetical protein
MMFVSHSKMDHPILREVHLAIFGQWPGHVTAGDA